MHVSIPFLKLFFRVFSSLFYFFAIFTVNNLIGEELPELWRYTSGNHIYDVEYEPETQQIFLAKHDSYLHCLQCDKDSAHTRWTFQAKSCVGGVTCDIKNRKIFCGSNDKILYCLNYCGELLWSWQATGYIRGISCDSKNKKIFFGCYDGTLYCLDYKGTFLWSYKTKADLHGVACDPEGYRVFFGGNDKTLHCLNYSKGTCWEYNTESGINGVAYNTTSKNVFFGSSNKKIYCLDDNGNFKWSFLTKGSVLGITYDPQCKLVICASTDGNLYCLNENGELLLKHNLYEIAWHVSLAIDPKRKIVFIPSNKGIGAIQYGNPNDQESNIEQKLDIEKILQQHEDRIQRLEKIIR